MKRNYLKVIVTVSAIILVLSVFLTGAVFAADTIRIGWTADMPGVGATFYASQKKALELFVEERPRRGFLVIIHRFHPRIARVGLVERGQRTPHSLLHRFFSPRPRGRGPGIARRSGAETCPKAHKKQQRKAERK